MSGHEETPLTVICPLMDEHVLSGVIETVLNIPGQYVDDVPEELNEAEKTPPV